MIAASRKGNPSINIDNQESIDDYFENSLPLDSIICVAGNASFGKLPDLNEEQINLGIRSKLLGQVNLVKKGI